MGCIHVREVTEASKKSKQIDAELKEDFKKEDSTIKLLLLGAGESGKSTIVKQMKILHLNGFTNDECQQYKTIVFCNTVQSITAIIRAMGSLKIDFSDPNLIEDARKVFAMATSVESGTFSKEFIEIIKKLWRDKGVQASFERSSEYQLNDSAAYFLNALDRFADPNYIPTESDVLHTRVKTTGIIETFFSYKGINMKIVDVGGQRSERRKWIHCFEGVNVIIFVEAISEYDQFLKEDDDINRMHESLNLFNSVCNNRWFEKSSMLLFLNKKDIFAKKIKITPLSVCFAEYKGKNEYNEATNYVRSKFENLNKFPTKQIFTHYTCATDTSNIEHVFNVVFESVIARNINDMAVF